MSLSTGKNNCALILSTTTQQGGRVHEDTLSASFLLSHETERRILNPICSILRSEAHLLHTTCCTVFCCLGFLPENYFLSLNTSWCGFSAQLPATFASLSPKWTTVPVSNSSLLRWLVCFKTFQKGFFFLKKTSFFRNLSWSKPWTGAHAIFWDHHHSYHLFVSQASGKIHN